MTPSPTAPTTLFDLIQLAPATRTAIILPEQNIQITYGTLRQQVETVASELAACGISRGDRLGIALGNGLPTIVCVLAASVAGTAAPLNPAYREDEFRFYLDDTGARVLLLPPDGADQARRAAGDRVRVVSVGMDASGAVHLAGISRNGPAPRPAVEDTALVRHTSMDEAGRHLEPGERGEVVIKGPSVIRGYENNPEANATSFVGDWLRTGDQGYLDADGYLTLVGRLKELINRGGEKISPREIDEVLLAHPAVAEAACFGVPHPTWGEEVAAAVVLSSEVSEVAQAFSRSAS